MCKTKHSKAALTPLFPDDAWDAIQSAKPGYFLQQNTLAAGQEDAGPISAGREMF